MCIRQFCLLPRKMGDQHEYAINPVAIAYIWKYIVIFQTSAQMQIDYMKCCYASRINIYHSGVQFMKCFFIRDQLAER